MSTTTKEAPVEPELQNRAVLALWQAIFEGSLGDREVIPLKWASRIVASYSDLRFTNMKMYARRFYAELDVLHGILRTELDGALMNPRDHEEDRTENYSRYLSILLNWQKRLIVLDEQWDCEDEYAAIDAAILSELHKFLFDNTGLTAHLDEIGLVVAEADQKSIYDAIVEESGE